MEGELSRFAEAWTQAMPHEEVWTLDIGRPLFCKSSPDSDPPNKAIVQGQTLPDESTRHTDVRDDRHQRS
jgi:hypothetical protein